MTSEIFTIACNGPGLKIPDPDQHITVIDNRDNRLTPCEAYQVALDGCSADVMVVAHDDVTIWDKDWLDRLMRLFENPRCVAAGPGGAASLGRPDLYKKRWNIWQMARGGYASNQTDAETHGERFTGNRRVAVLDAFIMAIRVDWLRSVGGWPANYLTFHCLDLWLACAAARDDREVFMSGFSVTHHGGGASTSDKYRSSAWLQGGSMDMDHQVPHRWLADSFIDTLPISI